MIRVILFYVGQKCNDEISKNQTVSTDSEFDKKIYFWKKQSNHDDSSLFFWRMIFFKITKNLNSCGCYFFVVLDFQFKHNYEIGCLDCSFHGCQKY